MQIRLDSEWESVRLHEYGRIFSIPGLYEHVLYDLLDCKSPEVIRETLREELEGCELDAGDLRVLDLGAGNGCAAEELARLGVRNIVGLDVCEDAARAAERDRPGLYDDYVVGDLASMSSRRQRRLKERSFNCLVSVAALGFGDIAPETFLEACTLIEPRGWVAFTIKESFVRPEDPTGFARLLDRLVTEGELDLRVRRRYRHRYSTDRRALHYVVFLARKRGGSESEPAVRYGQAPAGRTAPARV